VNLLSNALKFTLYGFIKIKVSLVNENDNIEVEKSFQAEEHEKLSLGINGPSNEEHKE
jgi:signal transduction histidine kinase